MYTENQLRQREEWFLKEKKKKDILMMLVEREREYECPTGETELPPQWGTNVVYYEEAFAIVKYHPPPP